MKRLEAVLNEAKDDARNDPKVTKVLKDALTDLNNKLSKLEYGIKVEDMVNAMYANIFPIFAER